jgi:hypothetical protein
MLILSSDMVSYFIKEIVHEAFDLLGIDVSGKVPCLVSRIDGTAIIGHISGLNEHTLQSVKDGFICDGFSVRSTLNH